MPVVSSAWFPFGSSGSGSDILGTAVFEEDGGRPVNDRTEATDLERCDAGREVVSGASSKVS